MSNCHKHLLDGLLRDLVLVTFLTCSTRALRQSFKKALLQGLREIGISNQCRLYDFHNNRMLALYISELYGLAQFVPPVYTKVLGLMSEDVEPPQVVVHFEKDDTAMISHRLKTIQLLQRHVLRAFSFLARSLWQARAMGTECDGESISLYHCSEQNYSNGFRFLFLYACCFLHTYRRDHFELYGCP